jgi:Domain of unknown function (DUF4160)
MPVLASFEGISIEMYYNDHSPPHFHACYADKEAVVQIANLTVIVGDLPPAVLRKVQRWAIPRQAQLALQWVNARSHLPLGKL